MLSYAEILEKYKTGSITLEEANIVIDFLNMGSDYHHFPSIEADNHAQ